MNRQRQEPRGMPVSAADWFAANRRTEKDPNLERAFEEWLAGNPERQRQYALCEVAWDLSLPLAKQLRGSVSEDLSRPRVPHRRWVFGLGLAAGTLAAAVALWLTFDARLEPLRYVTGPGEQRSVALIDGSRIMLNTRTTVEVTIHQGERDVFLKTGEVFFDVTPDPARPFRVQTSLGEVRVLGTRFAVYQRAHTFEVSNESGLVRVTPAGESESAAALLVRPGESAMIAGRGALPRLRHANLNRIDNWRRQLLEFDDVPLAKLLDEFSWYTAARLRAADPSIAVIHVSGVFHIGDVDALTRTLHATFGLVVRDSGHGELLVERG